MPYPALGSPAPTFQLPVTGGAYPEGTVLSSADLTGKSYVLYFYPKDDTPGCTTQACALRDGWNDRSKKAAVFGVSIGSVKSHQKFIQKYSLPFPLLADALAIAQGYGMAQGLFKVAVLEHVEHAPHISGLTLAVQRGQS